MTTHPAPYLPFLILIPVIALIVWRNAKPRRLRVEILWVRPAILCALAIFVLARTPPTSAVMIAACAAALGAGGVLGWLRGRMMRISVDPETHMASVQGSPLAVLFILAIIAVRFGMRYVVAGNSGVNGHLSQWTDVLLLFGVGVVGVQGAEMWLRARRLIGQSKAGKVETGIVS